MPIKDLSNQVRMSRIGKLHLGIKVQGPNGEYPKAVDYFVFPQEHEALEKVKEIYGDKPREIDIMFPTDNPEDFASQYYRSYSRTRGLVCLSEDTEILTDQGWRTKDTLDIGGKALTLDTVSGTYTEQAIQGKIILDGPPSMFRFHTKSLDALLTPDHRVVYKWSGLKRWKVKSAEDLASSRSIQWPISGPVAKPDLKIPVPYRRNCYSCGSLLNAYRYRWPRQRRCESCANRLKQLHRWKKVQGDPLEDDVLRLLAWIITDGGLHTPGWARNHKRPLNAPGNRLSPAEHKRRVCYLYISQSKEAYVQEIDQLVRRVFGSVNSHVFKNNGGPANRNKLARPLTKWHLGARESKFFFNLLGEDIHRIPRLILRDSSPRQLRVFYESLVQGDGSKALKRGVRFYPGKSIALADDFQELCTRLGYRSSITSINKQGDHPSTRGQYCLSVSETKKSHTLKNAAEAVPYTGQVWCIRVTNGTFVARRNGRVFTTGNCKGDGENATRLVDLDHVRKTGEPIIAEHTATNVGLMQIPCPGRACNYYEGKRCKEVMNLQFFLPKLPGIGVWQIDTGSYWSIVQVNSAIKMLAALTGGRVRGVPLKLVVGPKEVSPDGKKKTVWCMDVKLPALTLEQVLGHLKALPAGEFMVALPEPDDEMPDLLFPDAGDGELPVATTPGAPAQPAAAPTTDAAKRGRGRPPKVAQAAPAPAKTAPAIPEAAPAPQQATSAAPSPEAPASKASPAPAPSSTSGAPDRIKAAATPVEQPPPMGPGPGNWKELGFASAGHQSDLRVKLYKLLRDNLEFETEKMQEWCKGFGIIRTNTATKEQIETAIKQAEELKAQKAKPKAEEEEPLPF